jgi:membrane dipeptidase
VLFYIQTWDPLGGSVKKLSDWNRQGLRILNIAYGRGHNLAPEDVLGRGTGETGGLTPMGVKVVAELNRLQMVVDVAHANDQTTIDVCRASKAPVVATHANCRAVTPVDRNKSDEALKAIAKTGGVIGVASIGWMIADPSGKKDVAAFIKHIDHLKNVVGIDHIGLASDAFLNGWAPDSNHYACPELAAPDRWKTVAKALAEKGYSAEDIQKILGLNWVRAFKAILPP